MNGWRINGEVANVSIGLLLIFALGSIGIYGFIVGGWASESKFSILGSMRTCAQLVSYEVSLALSVLGVVILGRSLNLAEIVHRQGEFLPFVAPQFIGMLVFFFGGIAETSRAPFDLPEAEQELVAGYHTEYSGMRWGLFQMAEYINLITLSGLMVTLFFSRLARAVAPRADLVHPQAARRPLRLHLAAHDAAAAPLRPADALRLEGPAARRDGQRRRHGRAGGGVPVMSPSR